MKTLKLYHFGNQYGQTHFDSGNLYVSEGASEDYRILPHGIIDFFDEHSCKVSESKRTQNIRFRSSYVQFLQHLEKIFISIEEFDKHTDILAEKFKNSLKRPPVKSFYLIFYVTTIGNDECLSVLTMEARQGIQVKGNEFNILKEILPDRESRLKKAAIVYKKESLDFKKESDQKEQSIFVRHATLIDSRSTSNDVALPEYFFDTFLDGEVVADNPTAVSKIILDVVPNTVSPFLNKTFTKKDVTRHLKTKFSNETKSSFIDILNGIEDFLSKEKMNEANHDLESLSELAFSNARNTNKTITKTFVAKVTRSPKTIIKDKKDDGKSIRMAISKKSLDNRDVLIDQKKDKTFHIIKVKKSLVEISKTN